MTQSRIVVGIVAEGPTDVVVMTEYLHAWLARHDSAPTLEVRPVQPEQDATSGLFGDGGWTFVKSWCENNTATVRALGLFQPLFQGERPLDVLIVQLDGDRVAEYSRPYPDIVVPTNADAAARGSIVEAVLERWLWGGSTKRNADPNQESHCLVAAVRATETWIVAGLDPSLDKPEEIAEPELELTRLEPTLRTRYVGGVNRLNKYPPAWRRLAKRAGEQLQHIAVACPHCGKLLAYMDRLTRETIKMK